MRLDHPIFQGPLSVDVQLDADHPYEDAHDGQGTWLVHSGEFGQGCDVGMVSDGHGFEDSPDCERISGGINSKGPRAVAIGRQANLLQWGFYGAPDRMTDSAKRAFLNAIVWMKRFDGHVPLVQKQAQGRTWLVQYIEALEKMTPQQLADTKENGYATYLKKRFPAALVQDGVDAAKLRAWYAENEEFLAGKERHGGIAVDEDLQRLSLSNRKPAFLDWLVKRFAADPRDELALRLAQRYLDTEVAGDGKSVVAWIERHRPFLFFSDTGGYRWFVDVNAVRAAAKSGADAAPAAAPAEGTGGKR